MARTRFFFFFSSLAPLSLPSTCFVITVPNVFPVFGEWAGQNQFAMLVYSNEVSGETLTFKFYDSETDTVYDISDTYEFVSDITEGSAIEPIIFNFNSSAYFSRRSRNH